MQQLIPSLPVAESGNKKVQLLLGLMYDNGLSIKRNYSQAAYWYSHFAEQGYAGAQDKLGHYYETGTNTKEDLVQSHLWYSLAADAETKQSIIAKDRVTANLSESQLQKSQGLFVTWKNVFRSVI
ncbi:MAG: sel1 repeat family protein [Thiotrichales bacterium]|nr:sel1 repeat family protein [Thiotrichales bacterium]